MNVKLTLLVAASAGALVIACGGQAASSGSGSDAQAADAGQLPSSSTSACTTPGAVPRLEDGECKQTDGAWGAEGSELFPGLCCVRCKANEVASSGHIARCIPQDSGSAAPAANGGACGLALYPADYPARCQVALDAACCSQESVCAADAACAKAVECLKQCAPPRTDACTSACFGAAGGTVPAAFDALATCSKSAAFDPDGGTECSYP
jgi:hypothetical protein